MGVPNWVDAWGKEWDHDWMTWRAKLPRYLDEWTSPSASGSASGLRAAGGAAGKS
jgi:hypothetical protein